MMLYPSHFVGNKRFHKVAMEEVKLVSNPIKLSFASVVVGEGSRKQGYEPMGRWARAVVYKPSPAVASVSRIAIGRAFAKVVGMKGVIGITSTSENQGIFFVESTDLTIYLHEKRFILVSEKIKVKLGGLQEDRRAERLPCFKPCGGCWEKVEDNCIPCHAS
ncbi:hypothetical protein CK203_009722 [Vitis vinifera]|uniref:Uncharacterized protein n=1 Tax=Vitis vinifera TaxID=29760 RepID=A0A438JV67_VITVI|nr:hypothetical protein CK203_009722 [Vitis vinifera]